MPVTALLERIPEELLLPLVGLTCHDVLIKFGISVFALAWWMPYVKDMTSGQRQAWSQASPRELLNVAMDLRLAWSQKFTATPWVYACRTAEGGWPKPHTIAAALIGAVPVGGRARKRLRDEQGSAELDDI